MPSFSLRRLILPLVAVYLALHAPQIHAQDASFQPAPLFPASSLELKTLPNGVRAVLKPTKGLDVVSVQVWVRAGSRFETEGDAGAAHVIEALALRGSTNYPARQNADGGGAEAIGNLGGNAASLTSRDAVFYSATVASSFFPAAMRALSDAVLRPDLSLAAIEDVKAEIVEDNVRRSFDPIGTATDIAYDAAFVKHPYRFSPNGDSTVGKLSPAKIREFFRRRYTAPNISVIIVGDISPADAQKLLERHFSAAPKDLKVAPKFASEPLKEKKTITRRAAVIAPALVLAWPSPSIQKPEDVVAADALLALWREGFDANLRRLILKDEAERPEEDNEEATPEETPAKPTSALALSFDVDYLTQRDMGLFIVSFLAPRDANEIEKVMLAEIKRLQTEGPSEEEVKRARSQLIHQYIQQSATVSSQAGALGFYDMIDSYKFAANYVDRCKRVTNADIQRMAKTYLSTDKFLRVDLQPLPRPPAPVEEGGAPVITAQLPGLQKVNWEVAR